MLPPLQAKDMRRILTFLGGSIGADGAELRLTRQESRMVRKWSSHNLDFASVTERMSCSAPMLAVMNPVKSVCLEVSFKRELDGKNRATLGYNNGTSSERRTQAAATSEVGCPQLIYV